MSILIYLATIFWSLFPNLIHVFQGGDDFINKVNATNLVNNGDFSEGLDSWANYYNASLSLEDNALKVIKFQGDNISTFRQLKQLNINVDDLFYFSIDLKTTHTFVYFRLNAFDGAVDSYIQSSNYNVISNDFNTFSHIGNFSTNISATYLGISIYVNSDIDTYYFIDNIYSYNVSTMINNGVKSDDGILLSDLSNEEIKTQLDTWIAEHGDLSFTITKDNTFDSWFNTGFVDKNAERDFLDYLGYFFWLMTPPIMLFITLDLIRRLF